MKLQKTILLSYGLAIGFSAMAQLPVSQTAENKNVILEEFTGIYCGNCPAGHAIANQLEADNPGDVFLINVHTGGYANPNSGDPDFRTSFGSDIKAQTGLMGYPAGTVNRHLFPGLEQGSGTAMSRSNWGTASAQILAEPSYVNVALEADIDAITREITVDVQLYFTGAAPATVNLNVALTQDNIEGPQYGSISNPAGQLPNGNYNHSHMLRHLITGQWGDVITTSQGQVISQQYTYTIPADLNGVPYELGNLHLIAFVAEGQQEIITGNSGPINIVLPTGLEAIDVEASTNMTFPSEFCDYNITPEITVTNNSSSTVDTMEVSYDINGGTPVTAMVYQSISSGASYTHVFPTTNVTPGENIVNYFVSTDDDLSSLDLTTNNNSTSSAPWNTVPSTAFATDHTEGFESYSIGEATPGNAILENPDGSQVFVVNSGISGSVNHDLGGFGNSSNSYRWRFVYISSGEVSSLIWEKLDFSGDTGYEMSFSHAYRQGSNENDNLDIYVSTDCGASWTSVWSKSGGQLATVPASTSQFYPEADEWVSNLIDLSAYDGETEVMIKMEGTSDNGNNLYIDDINISANAGPNLVEELAIENLNVYPNPTNSLIKLEFNVKNIENARVEIYNAMGKLVYIETNLTTGLNTLSVSAAEFRNGIYYVNVIGLNSVSTQKVTVLK